jgi:hypothetical protein
VSYPRQVSPSDKFTVSFDAEYAVSTNATIRAAALNGPSNANGSALWDSVSENVAGGGDKVWTFNLTAPATEGAMLITVVVYYYSNNGTWTYFNDSTSGPGFVQVGIKVAALANLAVYLGYSNVQISIGNVTKNTDAQGILAEEKQVGREYSVAIPSVIQFDNSTRLVFNSWEDGSNATTRNWMLEGDIQLNATYRPQYLVQINSIVSTYSSQWYNKGSNITLSAQASVPMGWPLGALGMKYNFLDWSGSVLSENTKVNVTVNEPMVITANFVADYSELMLLIIPAVGILGALILIALKRRKQKEAPVAEHSKNEKPKLCPKCNEPVEVGWNNCINCGAKLGSETVQN